jgi:hypothetical protein
MVEDADHKLLSGNCCRDVSFLDVKEGLPFGYLLGCWRNIKLNYQLVYFEVVTNLDIRFKTVLLIIFYKMVSGQLTPIFCY